MSNGLKKKKLTSKKINKKMTTITGVPPTITIIHKFNIINDK